MGPSEVAPTDAHAFDFIRAARMGNGWLHPIASNYTFVVELELDGLRGYGVYKPERGETPLWDFPAGLYKREYAAYQLSELLGWGLVPPTVVREDGELGIGSLQLYVPPKPGSHYFDLRSTHRDSVIRLAAFDWIANNADRKGGHCFVGESGGVWAIDNGLTFHEEHKLRTVIWDFAGENVPQPLIEDIEMVQSCLSNKSQERSHRLVNLLFPA